MSGRLSQQVLEHMRHMVDHTYLTELIDALESIDDLRCPPNDWDSQLACSYPVKPFERGPFKDMGLWHAHFPLSGSVQQVISANFLKNKKLNAFVHELVQKNRIDEYHIEKVIDRHLDMIVGVSGKQSSNITADWLLFLPTNYGNQYLYACEHLNEVEEKVLALAFRAKYPEYFDN